MHNIFKKEETKNSGRGSKTIRNKNLAYTKYLNTKQLEDEIDYKRQRAIAKREIRRRHRQSWKTFIPNLESDL
jgi:hypothetical protein